MNFILRKRTVRLGNIIGHIILEETVVVYFKKLFISQILIMNKLTNQLKHGYRRNEEA